MKEIIAGGIGIIGFVLFMVVLSMFLDKLQNNTVLGQNDASNKILDEGKTTVNSITWGYFLIDDIKSIGLFIGLLMAIGGGYWFYTLRGERV